jgi:hypothetical protein
MAPVQTPKCAGAIFLYQQKRAAIVGMTKWTGVV